MKVSAPRFCGIMPSMKKSLQTGWGQVASWYEATISSQSSIQTEVILPSLKGLLAKFGKDKTVLDLGTGTGFFVSPLLETGAKKVLAVDVDDNLLEQVRNKFVTDKRVEVIKNNAEKLESVKTGSVDLLLSVESLVNMQRLDKVLDEAKRVLATDGVFLAVVNHPAFRVPQSSDWYFDQSKNSQGRVVYQYKTDHPIKIDMNPGQKTNKQYTYTFHRSLESYMNLFKRAGFAVSDMKELYSHKKSEKTAKFKQQEDLARQEIPMFLVFELVKKSTFLK